MTLVVVIFIVKKCKKNTQQTQQPPMIQLGETNIRNFNITADANIEHNLAHVKMQSNPAYTSIVKNNSPDVKMQSNPAYHIMQRDDSHKDEDDYYYY